MGGTRTGWTWRAFAGGGLLLSVLYFAAPVGPVVEAAMFTLLSFSVVVAFGAGIARHRPRAASPWILLGVGQLLFVVGDTLFNVYELAPGGEVPFPSVADGFYLAAYPFLAAALLLLLRSRSPGEERSSFFDAAIFAVSAGMIGWVFLMAPYASDRTLTLPEQLISIAYPLMDVLLVGIALRLLVAGGGRSRPFRLLMTGLLGLLVADILYGFGVIAGTYESGAALDAGWLLQYVTWGAAALHPSMRHLFDVVPYRAPRFRRGRLALLGLAGLMAPGTLALQEARGEPAEVATLVGGAAIVFLLVLGQVAVLIRRLTTARRDPLTGLHQREALTDGLRAATAAARRGQPSALLYLDVHRFNALNEALGRSAGDRALAAVARVLEGSVRPEDLVVRVGGDEFTVLAGSVTEAEATGMAQRIRAAAGALRFGDGARTVDIALSIGVAPIDEPMTPDEALLRGIAAYNVARGLGRHRVASFRPDEAPAFPASEEAPWAARLREALLDGRFTVLFQPIVDLADGTIHHHEALVRLVAEDGTLVAAGEFIPPAERLGLIGEIDRWVLHAVLDRIEHERARGRRLSCTINLSALSLADASTLPLIEEELTKRHLDPALVTFEITETAAVTDLVRTRALLERLRSIGCGVALDDFGSGFSSFAYLQTLPVDLLKIDRAFIAGIRENPVNEAMVRSIGEVARVLGIRTVGEGIEDVETVEALRSLGVDFGQGYYLGRPAPVPVTESALMALAAPVAS